MWLYADVGFFGGSFVTDRPDAPFGPLTSVWPVFQTRDNWPFTIAGVIAGLVFLLCWREYRHSRQMAGATRAKYSG